MFQVFVLLALASAPASYETPTGLLLQVADPWPDPIPNTATTVSITPEVNFGDPVTGWNSGIQGYIDNTNNVVVFPVIDNTSPWHNYAQGNWIANNVDTRVQLTHTDYFYMMGLHIRSTTKWHCICRKYLTAYNAGTGMGSYTVTFVPDNNWSEESDNWYEVWADVIP